MTGDGKIYYEVVDECFNRIHDIVGEYLEDGYDDEAFTATIYLMAANILTWGRANKLNLEQFMEHTFDDVTRVVSRLEKEK